MQQVLAIARHKAEIRVLELMPHIGSLIPTSEVRKQVNDALAYEAADKAEFMSKVYAAGLEGRAAAKS